MNAIIKPKENPIYPYRKKETLKQKISNTFYFQLNSKISRNQDKHIHTYDTDTLHKTF